MLKKGKLPKILVGIMSNLLTSKEFQQRFVIIRWSKQLSFHAMRLALF